jgi:hypothetical protein
MKAPDRVPVLTTPSTPRAQTAFMRNPRLVAASGLLLVEVALAVLGVLVHYGFTAEYGDVTSSWLAGFRDGFTAGIGGLALGIVGAAAVVTALVAPGRWPRGMAVAIPLLMVAAMLVVTPFALQSKLDVQYDDSPQCLSGEDPTTGPGAAAARESQAAFDSIDHVGYFGGGGGSGVGGCDRRFLLLEELDVLGHYRVSLPEAGWAIVEDDEQHLRAEREGMAFEVARCSSGGIVWAGAADAGGLTGCGPAEEVGLGG